MAEKTSNEALVKRIQEGERHLMAQLLEQNRGIIHHAARRYLPAARRNRALDMEDLTQAAALGMLEAVPAWNEARGAFATLAALYMKNSIRAALGIHTTRQRVENMPCASLDAPMEEGEDTALIDTLADEAATDPAEAAALADMRRTVRAVAAALPEREYAAIKHLLDGGPAVKDERGKVHALTALGRNIKLMRLWEEYGAAPYRHRGFDAWTYTHTSATEAAVLARERALDGLKRHIPCGRYKRPVKTHRAARRGPYTHTKRAALWPPANLCYILSRLFAILFSARFRAFSIFALSSGGVVMLLTNVYAALRFCSVAWASIQAT